jgi:hypothetical protein
MAMDNPPCIVDFLMKTSKDQGDIAMFDFRENALILITVTSNNHESPLSTIKSELLLVLKSPKKIFMFFWQVLLVQQFSTWMGPPQFLRSLRWRSWLLLSHSGL